MMQAIMGALTVKDVLTAAPRLLDSAAKLLNQRSGGRKDDAVAKLIQQVVKDQTVLARELQEASDRTGNLEDKLLEVAERASLLELKLQEVSSRAVILGWGMLVSASIAVAALVLGVLL